MCLSVLCVLYPFVGVDAGRNHVILWVLVTTLPFIGLYENKSNQAVLLIKLRYFQCDIEDLFEGGPLSWVGLQTSHGDLD